ncbi:MAG: hypothetical protein IT518_14775 [Burkholderiales bacterium]|nr:hypothetical protein [Burkholderiales bacterium]
MSISIVPAKCQHKQGTNANSAVMNGYDNGVVAGDLMVCVFASYRMPTGFSSGWTEFVTVGSTGQYLRALWRIAAGNSNDNCTASFLLGGQVDCVMAVLHSDAGFTGTPVKSHSENVTGASSSTSYALATALSSVVAGELPAFIGGHSASSNNNLTLGVSGTNWAKQVDWVGNISGHAMIATSSDTGSIPAPSVTFSAAVSSIKYAVGLVLQEVPSSGLAGGGLFWGQ